MFTPYDYQEECLLELKTARTQGKAVALIVMASGLGKTVTMAFDARNFRKQFPKARVLYLCHQNQISNQSRATFEAINGNDCTYGYYNGIEKTAHSVDFLFASFQTMRTHMKNFRPDEFDYVVVDESHCTYGETFLDVVIYWESKFLLGMTATPDRMDCQDIRKVFGQEVFYLPLEESLAQSLLTPVDYRLITDEIHLKKTIESAERRLSLRMLNRTIFVPKRDEEIVRIIQKHSQELEQPKIIVFCQSIKYAERLAKIMPGSMTIHSHISLKERIVRTELFRQGLITTLLTVDCFNEGIDIPEANVIVFLRTTTSHRILFQQLGRGLRLSEGKDRVIVLDFVGNCERVKTIYTLWDEVKLRRQKIIDGGPVVTRNRGNAISRNVDPFCLNMDVVNFEEKVLKVIDIIRRINEGYTYGECITALKAFANDLGRSPTQQEVQRNFNMPSPGLICRYFGDFSKALVASGLIPNQLREVSNEGLLQQLRRLVKKLGHSPMQKDIAEASKLGKCCSIPVFVDRFGSIAEALEKIGCKPSRYINLSKPELCVQLQELEKKLGRIPLVADIIEASSKDETAGINLFRQRFGSWARALKAAGLTREIKIEPRYVLEDLFTDLRNAQKMLGRVPIAADITRLQKQGRLKIKSLGPYRVRFKKFSDAVEAAGLK